MYNIINLGLSLIINTNIFNIFDIFLNTYYILVEKHNIVVLEKYVHTFFTFFTVFVEFISGFIIIFQL